MCKLIGLEHHCRSLEHFSVRAPGWKSSPCPKACVFFSPHCDTPIDSVDPHYNGVRENPEFVQCLSRSSKSQRGFYAMSSQEWNQMEDLYYV